ncbi:hypothetical protein CE561_05015 [Thermoanaerobacterium thermosaccharolyticum]|uniref:Uncharacterized protein n=1 Tax=Thermoanaerobacterium thermosaccharolyticum TaxID=1517 RepID=A0A231VJV4_THETR|nr:DUF4127 family protein [Thermoanaerobacterium thermosaccharolyticum]OXT08500.1 hypothetical protein CE561_05015 [Thermoanaerobacterium thermosaccharolyticum]
MLKKIIAIFLIFSTLLLSSGCNYIRKSFALDDNIIFVPLDSRPVNTQNVSILTKMWGKNLILPPKNVLDDYTKPGNHEALKKWLNEGASKDNVYAIVISVQQYINGGLIASRDIKNYNDYKKRLLTLYNFIKKNKDKNIIIFSVIPRLKPTQFSDYQYIKYNQQIVEFSELKDIVDLYHRESDVKKLEKIESGIPTDLIKNYNNLFEINDVINQKLIDWTRDGYIKTLVIGNDDTSQYSMTNMVSRKLSQYVESHGISDKVYMLHGADEIGMEITARLANEYYKQKPRFHVVYDVENPREIILPYEGADLKKIVEEKINFVGGKTDSNGELILYIHTNKNLGIKSDLDKYKNIGQNFGIADVAYTNMADANVVDAVLKDDPIDIMYAGWNTPSNAIGTVISEMPIKEILDKKLVPYDKRDEAVKSFVSFSFIRMADDYGYQAVVRNEMYKWAEANGINKDYINVESSNNELSNKMEPVLEMLSKTYEGRAVLEKKIKKIEASVAYPWDRMFEIEVMPHVELGS